MAQKKLIVTKMATFGSMTYFLKVGQRPQMQKWVWRMTNSAPDRVLINDPKKIGSEKSCTVTIAQWSETFPSRSDLSSDTIVQNVG